MNCIYLREKALPIQQILSNFGNAFMLRTDSDKKLEELRNICLFHNKWIEPFISHTQILSDIFTIEEIKKKPISKLNISWVGDTNNVLSSLIAASIKFSFNLKIGCQKNINQIKKF